MDRRTLLRSGVPLVAVGIAGCTGDGSDGGGDGDGDEDSPSPSPTDSPEPTDSPAESPTESPTASPEPTEMETQTPLPDVAQVVAVGPGGDLRFQPDSFEVAVDDTVRWEWESGGHNVSPTSVAAGSDWEGHDDTLYDEGTTHSHTFETAGDYDYVCQPHEGAGMTGSFTVSE
jgi:plastocyanin